MKKDSLTGPGTIIAVIKTIQAIGRGLLIRMGHHEMIDLALPITMLMLNHYDGPRSILLTTMPTFIMVALENITSAAIADVAVGAAA